MPGGSGISVNLANKLALCASGSVIEALRPGRERFCPKIIFAEFDLLYRRGRLNKMVRAFILQDTCELPIKQTVSTSEGDPTEQHLL